MPSTQITGIARMFAIGVRKSRAGCTLCCIAALLTSTSFGCLFGSINWSSDGKWLVFITRSSAIHRLPAGWWANPDTPRQTIHSDTDLMQSMWVCQIESRRCWRLAESEHGLSAAAWEPGGARVAYVRSAPDAGKIRLEVIVQKGFEDPVALAVTESRARSVQGNLHGIGLTGATAPAWSPDGSYLAVPWLDPPGTAVIRVTDGSVVAIHSDSYYPSWSPSGRQLVLAVTGEGEGYQIAPQGLEPRVVAIPAKQADQAAFWDPTGRYFYVVLWRNPPRGNIPNQIAELVRYDVHRNAPELVRTVMSRRPSTSGADLQTLFFARPPDSQTLIVLAPNLNLPTDVLELDFDRRLPARRHTILDSHLFVGSPSFGTEKDTMALRFGPPQSLGVPALFHLPSGELQAVVPDRATQVQAVETVIDRILNTFAESTPKDLQNPTTGWIRLPSPAALNTFVLRDGRVADRIERLVGFALGLYEAEIEGQPLAHERRALLESQMFLRYLNRDYKGTLRTIESLEPLLETGRERIALAVVRAQCLIGLPQYESAQELLTTLGQSVGKYLRDDPAASVMPETAGHRIRQLLDELAEAQKGR